MAAVPEGLERDLESAYRAHYPLLYRRARRWLPPDEAEDLVQETFLRAWARHGGANPGVPWLLTVLRNLAIDRSRRKRPELVDDERVLETAQPDEAADNVIRLEEARRVRRALEGLTEAQRRVLHLREWDGMSQQQIAASIGTTVPAVESLLLRGRRQLRKALDRMMGVALFPAAALVRRLRDWHPVQTTAPSLSAVGATVANLATAATIIVAGAASPLGPPPSGPSSPAADVPAVIAGASSATLAPQLVPKDPKPESPVTAVDPGTGAGAAGTPGSSSGSEAPGTPGGTGDQGSTSPPSGSAGGISDPGGPEALEPPSGGDAGGKAPPGVTGGSGDPAPGPGKGSGGGDLEPPAAGDDPPATGGEPNLDVPGSAIGGGGDLPGPTLETPVTGASA